jgi:hypothetical protein
MVHLRPLPGSPRYGGEIDSVLEAAVADLEVLAQGGADGAIIENFGDAPYYPGSVPPVTVAAMTAAALLLRAHAPKGFLLGINVLRNDAAAALSIAAVGGASFIRVNVHTGAVVADQGILTGQAHETLRLRTALGKPIAILADVAVKHAVPLGGRAIEDEARDAVERGMADAVLVTGSRTGEPVDRERLTFVRRAVPGVPVLCASGVDPENVHALEPHCDGFVIGTWLKRDGRVEEPVDPARVRRMALALGRPVR